MTVSEPAPQPVVERTSTAAPIVDVTTLRIDEFPSILFVTITTADGFVGLGETALGVEAVESYIHETVAPYLLRRDATAIERISADLNGYLGFNSTSVETRGNSAVDIALWDHLGQMTGMPMYRLLGGKVREGIRVYNTCVGNQYARTGGQLEPADHGIAAGRTAEQFDDLYAFRNEPEELARNLLDQGIRGMKVFPFDDFAVASRGNWISARDLDAAIEPLRRIRAAVGMDMELMIEFHALWQLPAAKHIAQALEEIRPRWLEDPIKADSFDSAEALARSTRIPVALSETLAGRSTFAELLRRDAVDVVIFDIGWVGGFSEALKVAGIADMHGVPIAPHDCTGPVVLAASSHLSVSAPNALIQEMVRAYYHGWYADLVSGLPEVQDGVMRAADRPGLGVALRKEVWTRKDAHVRSSQA